MKQYQHLLVVIEPKRDRQLALERAIEFVRYNPRAKITALRVIYDFTQDVHILSKAAEGDTRHSVEEETRRQLTESLAEIAAREGVEIEPKVVWGSDIGQCVIEEIRSGGHDLLLKGVNHHGIFDAILFTPIDWYLLRHAEIPVIIAKEHEWSRSGAIAVALDFTSPLSAKTNLALIREAQLLSTITGNEIHLINSAPVMLPTVMLEVPHYAPEVYAENIVAEHRRRLLAFADEHLIPHRQCHIEEGMPDDVIPRICHDIAANVVLIGSAGRSGASAALIGNTCEEVVDYINADLVVLNNRTVERQGS
ncbi:MAG: universal stress protein UspE [Succinivibrionaceae bacterium]|nr:universal stress protein UspE [Succinivibrionaceae bacterium]